MKRLLLRLSFTLIAILLIVVVSGAESVVMGILLGLSAAALIVTLEVLETVRTKPHTTNTFHQKKTKDLLVDSSALSDGRLIDLSVSGLFDGRLIVPRFLLNELSEACEILRKLETLPDLHLQYCDTDFPEIKETTQKILKLGRLLNADVLTADINRVQIAAIDGVRVINLYALSNALKPLMQRGEYLHIKIQRPGKEERQGVGYLEDGTMIVVNGGGDFMGKTIKASVLSVKHTSTGRMVFCNVAEEEMSAPCLA